MLACMVIIISVAVVSLYNNQKTNLVNMSRVSPPESAGVSGSVVVDPGDGGKGGIGKSGAETVGTANSMSGGNGSNVFGVIDNLLK